KRAYCLKTQPATGETYPKSDLFNKADADIKKAISLGISKINIHTELCQAAMAAVQENQNQPFLHVEREVRKAVKVRAMEKIKLFGSDGKAE
uniref:class II fructose-bisphosphate aldolase n=1 Tax=Klebsiella pneumoniae TaxID=573 RepID=UPI001D00D2DE